MIPENPGKSSNPKRKASPAGGARFPRYGIAGMVVILTGHALLATGNQFVSIYYTPIQWSGYILLVDALIRRRRGTSLISSHFGEFLLLLAISIASWLIFEAYNLLLQNWRYIGLPDSWIHRYIGYAWSFATISPGILLTYELVSLLWPEPAAAAKRASKGPGPAATTLLVALGAASLTAPLIWPSAYMTPLVWIGFVLFLDPVNGLLGERSIVAELWSGRWRPLAQFFIAGIICGVMWEFWNFWAAAKWEYSVPYWGDIKIFEMPVLGYFGFLPFTIECFALYTFMRRLIPLQRRERYLG
jgi:hypothetical protein